MRKYILSNWAGTHYLKSKYGLEEEGFPQEDTTSGFWNSVILSRCQLQANIIHGFIYLLETLFFYSLVVLKLFNLRTALYLLKSI